MWREHTLLWSVHCFHWPRARPWGGPLLPSVWVLSGDRPPRPAPSPTKKQGWGLGGKRIAPRVPEDTGAQDAPWGDFTATPPVYTANRSLQQTSPTPRQRQGSLPGVTGSRVSRGTEVAGVTPVPRAALGAPSLPTSSPRPRPPAHPNARSILLLVWPPGPPRAPGHHRF